MQKQSSHDALEYKLIKKKENSAIGQMFLIISTVSRVQFCCSVYSLIHFSLIQIGRIKLELIHKIDAHERRTSDSTTNKQNCH